MTLKNLAATVSPSYDKEEQIHSFSLLSNAAYGYSATSFGELQSYTTQVVTTAMNDQVIQGYVGNDWQLLWGPIVYSNNPNSISVVADNTMMLLYSSSQKLIIIAIAGTNIDSTYGWLKEDFNVDTTVSWQTVVGTGVAIPSKYSTAAISTGTNTGLQALLSMKDSSNNSLLNALTTLLANTEVPSGLELAVCGHSLGGALSPTMALYLQNIQQDAASNWNTSKKVTTVSAWPTAGPTPGESIFAAYLPTCVAYTSKYNVIDVIPHAWEKDTLGDIPSLYQPHILPPENVVGALAVGAVLNTYDLKQSGGKTPQHIDYTQAQPWTSLPGTFNKDTDDAISKDLKYINFAVPLALQVHVDGFKHMARFLAQLGYQHTTAYNDLLNITGFAAEYSKIKQAADPDNRSEEDMHMEALGRALGIHFGIRNMATLEKMPLAAGELA